MEGGARPDAPRHCLLRDDTYGTDNDAEMCKCVFIKQVGLSMSLEQGCFGGENLYAVIVLIVITGRLSDFVGLIQKRKL